MITNEGISMAMAYVTLVGPVFLTGLIVYGISKLISVK
jgi:hypothetical protein